MSPRSSLRRLRSNLNREHLAQRESSPSRHCTYTDGHIPEGLNGDTQQENTDTKPAAKSKHKFKFRAEKPGPSTTMFDSKEWHESLGFGFFILFWVVLALQSLRLVFINMKSTGLPCDTRILGIMMRDVVRVGVIDLVMYLSMYNTFFLQILVHKRYIKWNRSGWILQSVWQLVFLVFFTRIAKRLDISWIGRIFLVLHNLVMLMKQHSYAVYNGYLAEITEELAVCRKLKDAPDKSVRAEVYERIEFCEIDLQMQSEKVRYPENLTIKNFFVFTMFPIVVYRLEYVRTDRIRWGYVLGKALAVFFIIFIMIQEHEHVLYNVAVAAMELRRLPILERFKAYPLIFTEMMPSFMISFLLVFYLIWDAILNTVAELSYFGEREFYRDWWNARNWDNYARDWNVPVHNFLLRHVYHSSIATLHLSRTQGVVLTFLISAIVHELTMYVIFDRVRGYLLLFQLFQLPLEWLFSVKFIKSRPELATAFFWIGVCIGPTALCGLYLVI